MARDPVASASHLADCSSFFMTTVIPAPSIVIVTVTSTIVGGVVVQTTIQPQAPPDTVSTVTPTLAPLYATSSCHNFATPVASKFSSVCSCWGVTGTIMTEAVPTITLTATARLLPPAPEPSILSLIITTNPDLPCTGQGAPSSNGVTVINISGTMSSSTFTDATITFQPGSQIHQADYCLYPNDTTGLHYLDNSGIDFEGEGLTYELYTLDNFYFMFDTGPVQPSPYWYQVTSFTTVTCVSPTIVEAVCYSMDIDVLY